MIYINTSAASQAAVRDDSSLREIASLRRRLAASQELAAHRGHSLAITLDENRQMKERFGKLSDALIDQIDQTIDLEAENLLLKTEVDELRRREALLLRAMLPPPLFGVCAPSSEVVSPAEYAEAVSL